MTQDEKKRKVNFPILLCILVVMLGAMVVQDSGSFKIFACIGLALPMILICLLWFFEGKELKKEERENKKESTKTL